jgi:hypothetical protein
VRERTCIVIEWEATNAVVPPRIEAVRAIEQLWEGEWFFDGYDFSEGTVIEQRTK